jgi:hypothetical protein
VERHLNGIRLQTEDLPDLARGEIGAVSERDEVLGTLVEALNRCCNREPLERLAFEIFGRADLQLLAGLGARPPHRVVYAAACDPDQPRQRLSA